MSQLILDSDVWVPIADPCRPDWDPQALQFLARALSALRSKLARRFCGALELLEQVERGRRDNYHEVTPRILSVDFRCCLEQLLALRGFVGYH